METWQLTGQTTGHSNSLAGPDHKGLFTILNFVSDMVGFEQREVTQLDSCFKKPQKCWPGGARVLRPGVET